MQLTTFPRMLVFVVLTVMPCVPAFAQTDAPSAAELAERTLHRRAVEAAIWGMPIVAGDAMRQAYFRDADAQYGDIVYVSKVADWQFQMPTPNSSSLTAAGKALLIWLGKEVISLSPPPRRTVRTDHPVHGSSHRRTPRGALVL
jgi:hypothetical protein